MAQAAENGSGDAPTHPPEYAGGSGDGRVFVLSRDGHPLMPCHPARARELLQKGRAVVVRQTPFAIRLKDRTQAESAVDGLQLRIDPGSKGTGLALTDEKKETGTDGRVVTVRRGLFSIELQHRGDRIHHAMGQRAGYRHRRRSANCRYRAPRSNNATQARLAEALETLDRPVHAWPGHLTMANRMASGLGKTHTLDALSVGHLDHEGGDAIVRFPERVLVAKATGRGSYARTTPDRYGFPRLRRSRTKQHFGYVTGDLVRAVVPSGKWAGTWTGHISVRARGQHSLSTPQGRLNVSHRNLQLLQRGDGYGYSTRREAPPQASPKSG
ncbi:RRXRR domain-containing protein [Streptomyces sp. NPDC047061]|uniref:RRXRR domain-containing protein n=1 Tax=Streptomyces sp. NPDC047061 TaxID=3154605 RepID=UPI0033DBE337